MPALGFKEQFAQFVREGSKTHTIRMRRKHPIKKGDRLFLYMGMRTPLCQKLKEADCTGTRSVYIGKNTVILYPNFLCDAELEIAKINPLDKRLPVPVKLYDQHLYDLLAWNDGFRAPGATEENPRGCWLLMKAYFDAYDQPFVGDIIYWKK